ncbi:ABC transporter ATP-binding protein [Microbacterium amylolyticum]|uniref:Molybdate transport system ATP-binding protein n=1 Tax=Microbacterium amylolyticum TaxID=936337 RepID=A0ABS4ZFL1_9MICO|nr:ABC transporter ATP-binding protein [Microbacterium amylolyticum]MBP2435780.1 molybdate transport system ATP-binding protein [Microbacterium amylolyticum]
MNRQDYGVQGRVIVERPTGFRLDVMVAARPGEVIAVMGPSGAGKSTLLRALAGEIPITDGEFVVGDVRVTPRHRPDPRRLGVVMLDQRPLLFPHMTVRQNIAFGLRTHGATRARAHADADEWLWRVGVDGAGDHRPGELSGGQQQRVALARALATGPRLLLLDEPLTALDTETASDIRTLLREQLRATHTTAVVVTHDAFDAAALAHRMAVIENGEVTQRGDVSHVLAQPATRFVASAAGLNRLRGTAKEGMWTGRSFGVPVRISSAEGGPRPADGHPIVAVFRPADARIARAEDPTWTGALQLARNDIEAEEAETGQWLARVERLEPAPGGARVYVSQPELVVDVPSAQAAVLRLHPGDPVRVFIDPQHVRFIPAS